MTETVWVNFAVGLTLGAWTPIVWLILTGERVHPVAYLFPIVCTAAGIAAVIYTL